MTSVMSFIGILVFSFTTFAFEPLPKVIPTPQDNPTTQEKIDLGRMLYFDKRLSADNTVSCNTCHDATKFGVDGLPTSKGIKGQFGGRNAPTVFNSAFLSVQFWDGRAPTLEEQAKGPIINPIEMGMKNHDLAVSNIKNVKGYAPYFKKAFPKEKDPITINAIAKAIAAYERTLITPNSPLDKYLAGDKKALSSEAQAGMELFQTVGCVACHSGPAFAGPIMPLGTGFYQKFPTIPGTSYDKKYQFTKDLGRFEATKNESDKHMFRVPTLRNIAKTGPYFHNGKVKDLNEAVKVMAKTQLNKDLKKDEVKKLVAFLSSLTGEFPKEKEPTLPQ